jgi:phage tail-like protein
MVVAMSTYLDHLPAVFREDKLLGEFLSAFEAVLGELEDTIAGFADTYLDPRQTPPDFLPWLAGWVGLTLRADWDPSTKAAFIEEIVPLYRKRGTLAGLRRMLEVYLGKVGGDDVTIFDDFQATPHFFQVMLVLSTAARESRQQNWEIARAIIDREKPAHTFYALRVEIPTMRLPFTLGKDEESTLGTRTEESGG